MALVAIASDKGAPGVTTASVVLAAVWPRPVLLAECDPAGGDLAYRFPAADGGRLDPGRGLLSLAVAARRGLRPEQVWEHTQTLRGGLAVLAGVSTAEQGAGLDPLWGPAGAVLAQLPQGDVIADCGRVGVDGPPHDLLAQAAAIVLLTRDDLGEVVRLRERVPALAAALDRRDRMSTTIGVVVIAGHKRFHAALAEVGEALGHGKGLVNVAGGLAYDPRAARQLRGEWGDRLAGQRRRDAATGVPPMSGEDERQFARALIAGVLEEHARTEITAGRAPAGAQEEEELAAAVHAALFGVGRLQPLLDDPQIENIDINGCDRVFLSRADGREVMADPVADSDEELVELIQALAAYSGLSSRPFDTANPQLDVRLPDGSRLSAVMDVTVRPAVSIRRARLGKVVLSDLAGNGTISPEVASFLAAAAAARKNLMIAGARS